MDDIYVGLPLKELIQLSLMLSLCAVFVTLALLPPFLLPGLYVLTLSSAAAG